MPWLRLASAALALALVPMGCAKAVDTTKGALCEPGENIFCRCEGGEAGTRTCLPGGHAFASCVCDDGTIDGSSDDDWPPEDDGWNGSGGAGAYSSSQGGGGSGAASGGPADGGGGTVVSAGGSDGAGGDPGPTATLELLEPCNDASACISGFCIDGYCTRECTKVSDCPWPKAECVPRQSTNVCMPHCDSAKGCSAFGTPDSKCGFARAVDHWRVSVCSNWGASHALMPVGDDCLPFDHKGCNLGYLGRGLVCGEQGACVEGCYLEGDCPSGKTCSANGSLGQCQVSGAGGAGGSP